jgi:hypothetical protein
MLHENAIIEVNFDKDQLLESSWVVILENWIIMGNLF